VKESEKWAKAKAGGLQRPRLAELFTRQHRRDTLAGSALAFVAVFGLWGATNWTPSLVRELLEPRRLSGEAVTQMVSYAVMSLNAGAILGYLAFPLLAEWLGRKAAFFLMLLGSAIILPTTFLAPETYARLLLILPILGFMTNGIFSGFPVYLPELYPTRIRATGSGFCFNAGRVLASAGPFVTGYLVVHLGTFARAASSIALIYVLGMGVLLFARETKGQVLR
jgi:MFS family permease